MRHPPDVIFRWYSNTLQGSTSALERCGRVRQHQLGAASLDCSRLLSWGQEVPAPEVRETRFSDPSFSAHRWVLRPLHAKS